MERKLSVKTIAEKYAALLDVEKGMTKSQVAARHGVPRSTLGSWLKDATKIKLAFETGVYGTKTKRMCPIPEDRGGCRQVVGRRSCRKRSHHRHDHQDQGRRLLQASQ